MAKIRKLLHERPQGGLPSNTIPSPREDIKVITTWSGMTLAGPLVPSHSSSSSSTSSSKEPSPASRPSELPPSPSTSFVIPDRNPHQPPIPYPLRLNKEKLQDKSDIQIHSFLQMFKKLYFNIKKLLELANTPLNENCSAVLLKKLPEKLEDTRRFLIPCNFHGLESCIALADLGIAEDVFVQVGKFTFPVDFVVVDYDVDLCVPLSLGRPFLRMARALVDVHREELTLRVGDENLVFNVESTSKYPRKHGDESIHKIDILDITCEDHFYEVLNVQKSINPLSASPTPSSDTIVESLSPSPTPFGDSDFLLEETDAFLSLDDSIQLGIDNGIYDSEGDILFLEELLNDDLTPDLHPPLQVFKIKETEKIKSSIEDPPDHNLKDLPPHIEYAFLEISLDHTPQEGTSKLPVIISKDLNKEEKDQLLTILKSHKRAIAWKISDIRGIDSNFYTHKILMKDDFKLAVQHQRRSLGEPDSRRTQKGSMTVITNENNELIPTRLVIDQEKTTFTCPYGTFAYRMMPFGICNAPGTFQRCMVAIFHNMIEKTMEVFMDDFSVFGDSFSSCLSHLDMMLKSNYGAIGED
ncbi:reverse transcriptase domain-containing protein [Tanacetum coccineum]|uniref:Reverse transcriptase domain-containing protein n=1 Tax=Tanacetum coccineum TaxID=301880 RepID=A0ABQ4WLE5_9ASTR